MIDTGLFDEIKDLRNHVVQGKIKMPGIELEKYQRGLWQAIGYKEFDPYFEALEGGKDAAELEKIKSECTERMKAATRRYAKSQIKWIRNKLVPTSLSSNDSQVIVYCLDAGSKYGPCGEFRAMIDGCLFARSRNMGRECQGKGCGDCKSISDGTASARAQKSQQGCRRHVEFRTANERVMCGTDPNGMIA